MRLTDSWGTVLLSALEYNPKAGVFVWARDNRGHARKGDIAGSLRAEGYVRIVVNGRKFYAHRLAWFFVHGVFPENKIDHKDGDRANNSISNLRSCDDGLNSQNRDKARSDSKTQVMGVRKNGSRFQASIRVKGETFHLGSYRTIDEAFRAYCLAKIQLHPFSARLKAP